MDIEDLLLRFAAALGVGLMIGLERGWTTRADAAGTRTAGTRTFAITGLLGGVIGALAQLAGGPGNVGGALVLGLGFAVYAIAITILTRDENIAEKRFSATTAVAAMVAFALGSYALVGDPRIAAAAAVATTMLLALRENIHGFVKDITWPELRSVLVLLAMTFIALPVMPNTPIGPFGGVNPRDVWLTAIALAGVSFLGYGAVKHLGPQHGVLVGSAAGGIVSSTAVAVANARRAAAGEGDPRLLAAGVSIANAVSWLRVVAILAVLKPVLLVTVAPPLIAASLVAGACALAFAYWFRNGRGGASAMKLHNPFGFWSVIGFAIFLVAIILVGRVLGETLGAAGVLVGAALIGLGDVDAITVSTAQLTPQTIGTDAASYAVLAAVLSNTLGKLVLGMIAGRGRFAIDLAAMSAACILAGVVALFVGRSAAAVLN
ncbi:MAG: MgtC/SapB family protein [Pseudorhodoplanes sp.]